MDIEKTHLMLKPDPKRVLLRSFDPASEKQRTNIIGRVMNLSEDEAKKEFERISKEFGYRHHNIYELFLKRFKQISKYLDKETKLDEVRQLLIGASFSMEYSVESAALFNPSIVWHPDQSNVSSGDKRFILSLRATGEGHISSIVFRTGIIDAENNIIIEKSDRFISSPDTVIKSNYNKTVLQKKIFESGLSGEFTDYIFSQLGKTYTLNDLKQIVDNTLTKSDYSNQDNTIISEEVISLCRSEYEVIFSSDLPMSERIIFPQSPAESNGIEDARFLKFRSSDGNEQYYATYTAYDGFKIQSHLLETKDFLHFKINKLLGSEAKNKGMALFPREINGKYAMLSRQDNENNFIMFSDNLFLWKEKVVLSRPSFNWEMVQSGNCGSPIETEEGWLVLTHGVGPVRKYCIGAMLLDLDDPTKVIGRLKEPLLCADKDEREGYVPNVVYSCGSIIHGDQLIIPYAVSDYASSFAKINLQDLLYVLTTN
jgi:predicted GH43/DUF377 family glycosyl hydrolase